MLPFNPRLSLPGYPEFRFVKKKKNYIDALGKVIALAQPSSTLLAPAIKCTF